MPASVVCPSCQAKLRLPSSAAHKTVRCPQCGNSVSSPTLTESPSLGATVDYQPPGSPPSLPEPKRRRRHADETDSAVSGWRGAIGGIVGIAFLSLLVGGCIALWRNQPEQPPQVRPAEIPAPRLPTVRVDDELTQSGMQFQGWRMTGSITLEGTLTIAADGQPVRENSVVAYPEGFGGLKLSKLLMFHPSLNPGESGRIHAVLLQDKETAIVTIKRR